MENEKAEVTIEESTNTPAQTATPEAAAEEPSVETIRNRGWRAVFKEALQKAQQEQRPTGARRELGKDKSKSFLILAGVAVALLLIFLGVFSAPNKPGGPFNGRRPGDPNLGRRETPGEPPPDTSAKSVTPLLSADVQPAAAPGENQLTASDLDRTAGAPSSAAQPGVSASPTPNQPTSSQYAIGRIDPPPAPPAVEKSAEPSVEALQKPSLVFVRANAATDVRTTSDKPLEVEDPRLARLPSGARLVARLESPASSAVRAPVLAVIEYNYEHDGEIAIPAGTKAVGTMQGANSTGVVDLHFESVELPDGTSEKIDASAMDLNFHPLKGKVSGKNTGKRFLTTSLTGIGTAGALLFSRNGGLNSPYSEGDTIRNDLATNIGNAGNQELSNLSTTQNIVVTVPGNTQFFIVFGKNSSEAGTSRGSAAKNAASPELANSRIPSLEELRQLLQLRQELNQLYQQPVPTTSSSQQ